MVVNMAQALAPSTSGGGVDTSRLLSMALAMKGQQSADIQRGIANSRADRGEDRAEEMHRLNVQGVMDARKAAQAEAQEKKSQRDHELIGHGLGYIKSVPPEMQQAAWDETVGFLQSRGVEIPEGVTADSLPMLSAFYGMSHSDATQFERMLNTMPEGERAQYIEGWMREQSGLTPEDTRTAEMKNYEYAKEDGFDGSFQDFRTSKAKAGATQISNIGNTNNTPDMRPLADKPAKGYQRRWDAEKQTYVDEPIPGGEIDRKDAVLADKAQMRDDGRIEDAGIALQRVAELRSAVEGQTWFNPAVGFGSGITENARGSATNDFKARADTLGALVAFDALSQMRAESPTGGALGNVTERELDLLKATLASLSTAQSKEQVLEHLDDFERHYTSIMRKFSAYPNAGKYGVENFKSPEAPNVDFTQMGVGDMVNFNLDDASPADIAAWTKRMDELENE